MTVRTFASRGVARSWLGAQLERLDLHVGDAADEQPRRAVVLHEVLERGVVDGVGDLHAARSTRRGAGPGGAPVVGGLHVTIEPVAPAGASTAFAEGGRIAIYMHLIPVK